MSYAKYTPAGNPEQAIRSGAERGIGLAAEHVLGEARKIVPHETGVLERSGRATTEHLRASATGAVSFDTPYAVRQHENTHYRHKKGRKAKYLESALNSNKNKINAIVAAELRGNL